MVQDPRVKVFIGVDGVAIYRPNESTFDHASNFSRFLVVSRRTADDYFVLFVVGWNFDDDVVRSRQQDERTRTQTIAQVTQTDRYVHF